MQRSEDISGSGAKWNGHVLRSNDKMQTNVFENIRTLGFQLGT